jgi:hypothetical protein
VQKATENLGVDMYSLFLSRIKQHWGRALS